MITVLLIAGLMIGGLVFASGASEKSEDSGKSEESAQPEETAPMQEDPATEAPDAAADPEADESGEQFELLGPEDVQESEEDGFEQAKPEIEQQLVQEKQNEILMKHIEDLRGEADVEMYMDRAGGDDEAAVVAAVNGEEILNGDLMIREQQQMQQYTAMGMDPESEDAKALKQQMRPQILESLISLELIDQKAQSEGIEVDEAQIDQQYQSLTEQFGGEEALEEQLAAENLSKEELREDIANQLNINTYLQQYISENTSPEDFEFSEQEMRERYEQMQMQQQQMEQMQQQQQQE